MVLGRFVSPLDFSASCSSSLLQAKVHVHTLRSSLCREPRVNLESISLGLGPPPPLCPPGHLSEGFWRPSVEKEVHGVQAG